MNIKLKNETCVSQISIAYNTLTFLLKKNEEHLIEVDTSNIRLYVSLPEENKVNFNWLFALIDGFVSEEHIISSFNCNFFVDLNLQEPVCEIVFRDLVARDDKNGYIYHSLLVQTRSADVLHIEYNMFNTEKSKKKTLFYFGFIASWVPILLVLTFIFIFKGNIITFVAIFLILLMFSIPSWRKATRVKYFYSNKKANEMLLSEYNRLKLNGWNTKVEPNNSFDKVVFKIMDFAFNKKTPNEDQSVDNSGKGKTGDG